MRLLVVSNRLPFSLKKKGDTYVFKESPGGLPTGLSSYLNSLPKDDSYIWIGWPGAQVEDKETQKLIADKALTQYRAVPVFLSQELVDEYYNGFSYQTLWPLLHSFTSFIRLHNEFWKSYLKAQELFAKAVLDVYQEGDLILVQDLHLMLLPKLIRDKKPHAKISFFLHVPFPPETFYKLLPKFWRARLLEGLLSSDLLGFHINEYARNFKSTLLSEFDMAVVGSEVLFNNRPVKIGAFPLGIDVASFIQKGESSETKEKKEFYRNMFPVEKIIFSVDRLDYTKGITNKIEGFAHFLKTHPEWQGRVSLIMIVAPSREGVPEFRKTKEDIDKKVGEVNGAFGTLSWTPITYQYRTYSQEDLIALYGIADVALITPLRDGMNLTAKEYLASRTDKKGVLVLSKMAGAAHELKEALLINPFHKESISGGILQALTMSDEEKIQRNTYMLERLKEHDVFAWAKSFNKALKSKKLLHRLNEWTKEPYPKRLIG